MRISRVISATYRQRILRTLASRDTVPVMELVMAVNGTWCEVDRNLDILRKANLITEKRIGRKRILQLNMDNEKTLEVLEALKLLSRLDKPVDEPKHHIYFGESKLKEDTHAQPY